MKPAKLIKEIALKNFRDCWHRNELFLSIFFTYSCFSPC